MKHSQRQHLKENELAIALAQANQWRAQHQRTVTITIVAIVLVAAAVIGYTTWRNTVDANARELLAEAMVIYEYGVAPPTPAIQDPSTNATPAAPVQPPNTFPTEQAKLEAALPKFLAAADAYPSTDAGRMARYHAASVLVGLGRFDEALAQYDRVIAEGDGLLAQMSRLGKAEAQLRASQYDAAIQGFRELSERADTNLPKPAMLMELARAYKLAGNTEEARKTLTQITEQHADSPFATEARTELEKLAG